MRLPVKEHGFLKARLVFKRRFDPSSEIRLFLGSDFLVRYDRRELVSWVESSVNLEILDSDVSNTLP